MVTIASVLLTLYFDDLIQNDEKSNPAKVTDNEGFLSNEKFINSLHLQMNLENPDEVFRYVFSKLEDEFHIYPTENYYYFTFPANGKVIWGSIHLPAYRLDEGVLGFGYIEKGNDIHQTNPIGGSADYTSKEGVFIQKINNFTYTLTYENKTKTIKLNQLELRSPIKANLTNDEIFVEPTFDESGLEFFLIFNNNTKNLYWILNEDEYVPESFTEVTEDLKIGDRTGFAFYSDKENNRKVLVGVYGINVMRNNWYDGPFDQLLDNYVYTGQINIKKYLEESYPNTVERIDKFGNYLDNNMRVAIGSYSIYFFTDDMILLISKCKEFYTQSEFYKCITQENHQSLLNPPYP